MRPHRGPGRASVRRRRTSRLTYNLAGNGKSKILRPRARSRSSQSVRRARRGRGGRHPHGRRPGRRAGRRGAADLQLGRRRPPTSPSSSTRTRPRARPSARRTSRSPASRCTSTTDTPPQRVPTRRSQEKRSCRYPSRCPQLGESVTEGTVTRWLKKEGEHGRGRRAAARGLDRQGRHRDPLAGRRRSCARSRSTRTRRWPSAPSSR